MCSAWSWYTVILSVFVFCIVCSKLLGLQPVLFPYCGTGVLGHRLVSKGTQRFGGTCCCHLLVGIKKPGAVYSFKTLIITFQTARRHYLLDHSMNVRRLENVTSERRYIWREQHLHASLNKHFSFVLSLSIPGGNVFVTIINVTATVWILRARFSTAVWINLLGFVIGLVWVVLDFPYVPGIFHLGNWVAYFLFV